METNRDNRRADRAETMLDAEIVVAQGGAYPGRLMNLSRSGFAAMVDGVLSAGAVLKLKLANGSQRLAQIRWSRGTVIGCQFRFELSEQDFAELLSLPNTGMPRLRG